MINNLKQYFSPWRIYYQHIRQRIFDSGLLRTISHLTSLLYPTIMMMIYNYQISRSGKSGRYSMVTDDGQQRQFATTQWQPLVVGEPTYAGVGVMDVAEKVGILNSKVLKIATIDLSLN